MKRGNTGRYIRIATVSEEAKAFIPNALPPEPPLEIRPNLREIMDEALLALGRLDSVATFLPDTELFLYSYIRKEAVLSSQIEGTQSSLFDFLLFETGHTPGVPLDDVQEVSNYVAALNHGIERIKEIPICNRLIQEMHKILLSKGRGSDKSPGEFRISQNWIGGTRPGNAAHVPPPPEKVVECMSDLEKFINNIPEKTPAIIKSALVHAQFETIHPFLDGNGRIGRLLITLILISSGIIKKPLLYLSLYFKAYRQEYYEHLNIIRKTGDWEEWIEFFVKAIKETAQQAADTANQLLKLAERDREKIKGLGRPASSALRVHHALQQRPLLSIPEACEMTELWAATVTSSLKHLEKLGIVTEVTGAKRNRIYRYDAYVRILNEGTEI